MIAAVSTSHILSAGSTRIRFADLSRRSVRFGELGFRLAAKRNPMRFCLGRSRRRMACFGSFGGGCFRGTEFQRELKVEEDSGGQDVFDATIRTSPEHLVIMVNGLAGSAADWRFAAEQFVQKLPDKVIVHCSECNYLKLTFDGVDRMGERLAEEVLAVVKRRPEARKISFVAHSLGGLVARYAIGRLYEHSSKFNLTNPLRNSIKEFDAHSSPFGCLEHSIEGKIAGLEAMNFVTVASPHLGSRGHKQLPILCGVPFLETRAPQTAHLIVGRSGKHLFLTDKDNGKPPLLLRMVNDSDLKFISALRAFKRRVVYANANYDHIVGWRTSSIRRQHELPKPSLLIKDERYPHIVYADHGNVNKINDKESYPSSDEASHLEEEMIQGLTQVPWERVDVSFQKSRQRFIAHNTIQVNRYWLNSDGADVVFHIIDYFLL